MLSNKAQTPVNPLVTKKNKTNDKCIDYLQGKWREILTTRFDFFFKKSPESARRMEEIMHCMIQGLKSIFLSFSELKDTQFNNQVMRDDVGTYSQRMAEMLFYYQLLKMGFEGIESKDAGPDFVAKKNGEIFCFEVVTPTPQGHIRNLIAQRNLDPEDRDTVFRERLLSVTSAVKDKLKKFEYHKAKGHVPEATHYIIVVNDSLLLPYDQPWYGVLGELCFGDSTLPITVDATLGSGEIDFSDLLGEETSREDDVEFQSLIMRSNYRISVNGGEEKTPEESLLRVKVRKKIPTRKGTDTVAVDIAESMGVTGIYQITLREDLMFFHSFEFCKNVSPDSALISSVKYKKLARDAVFFTSKYSKDEALVQPFMSSASLLGYEPDEYNNLAVYNSFFRPVLEVGGINHHNLKTRC